MMKKQLLIASIALIVAGGGLVGITHAESDAVETNSGQVQTSNEVTNDDQQGNIDDSQQGNVEDNQQGNVDDNQVIWNMT